MCDFVHLLQNAQKGDAESMQKILEMLEPMLKKNSIVQERYDEDLYQELIIRSLKAIKSFKVND